MINRILSLIHAALHDLFPPHRYSPAPRHWGGGRFPAPANDAGAGFLRLGSGSAVMPGATARPLIPLLNSGRWSDR